MTMPKTPPAGLYQHSDLPPELAAGAPPRRQAAVLIPLIRVSGEWEVLFIRRATKAGDRHSGQVAFPGGAREGQDESLIETALRETHEEIGVPASKIQIIAELHPYQTISRYQVTPVVALMQWPATIRPEPAEVARVFSIPLGWLNQQNNYDIREYPARPDQQEAGNLDDSGQPSPVSRLPEHRPTERRPTERRPVIFFKHYKGEQLWGASARMTINFLRALDERTIIVPGLAWPPDTKELRN